MVTERMRVAHAPTRWVPRKPPWLSSRLGTPRKKGSDQSKSHPRHDRKANGARRDSEHRDLERDALRVLVGFSPLIQAKHDQRSEYAQPDARGVADVGVPAAIARHVAREPHAAEMDGNRPPRNEKKPAPEAIRHSVHQHGGAYPHDEGAPNGRWGPALTLLWPVAAEDRRPRRRGARPGRCCPSGVALQHH